MDQYQSAISIFAAFYPFQEYPNNSTHSFVFELFERGVISLSTPDTRGNSVAGVRLDVGRWTSRVAKTLEVDSSPSVAAITSYARCQFIRCRDHNALSLHAPGSLTRANRTIPFARMFVYKLLNRLVARGHARSTLGPRSVHARSYAIAASALAIPTSY